MNFMTFHSVGNVIIPTDELIFFRGVGIHQSVIKLSTIQLEEPPWANARDYHRSDILGLPQECKGDGLQQFERQSTYVHV